jgi:hypothetical protein
MRKLPAIFARFLAGLACLVLSACFDIREEVWIHPDGSGRAELNYTIPESALLLGGGTAGLEAKVRALVATQPKIRLDAVNVSTGNDEAKIVVKLSTDSMLSLIDLQKSEAFQQMPDAASNIAGTVVLKLKGLDVDFTRTVKVREALGFASLAIGADERAKRSLEYIIHLPKAAKESNATSVTDGGKTLVWKATLGEALRKPVVTRFRAAMPIPWFVHLAAGLLLLGIVALLLRIRRKRRQRREDACMVDL